MNEDTTYDKPSEIPADSELIGMTREEMAIEIYQLRKQVVRLAEEVVKAEMSSWQVQTQHERMEYLVKESRSYTELLQAQAEDLRDRLKASEAIKDDLAKAELILSGSAANVDRMQRLSHIGSWELDLKSDSIIRSREMMSILGASGSPEVSAADYAISMLIHPEDTRIFELNVHRTIADDVPVTFSCRIVKPDGAIRQIMFSAEVVAGEHEKVFGIAKDITP
jgi:PAS domain-containing protein